MIRDAELVIVCDAEGCPEYMTHVLERKKDRFQIDNDDLILNKWAKNGTYHFCPKHVRLVVKVFENNMAESKA